MRQRHLPAWRCRSGRHDHHGVTATAGSEISGNVTNTAEYFGDTNDPNPNNDSDTAQTTVNPLTALIIDKIDLTDPVYAGNTYLYEIVITNTGPSDAQNVVITDTLPSQVALRAPVPNARTMARPRMAPSPAIWVRWPPAKAGTI